MKENGIVYKPIGRKEHTNIKVAESINMNVVETTCYMPNESGLRKSWWGHKILYTIKVRNQCTTGNFRNKQTPYGRFSHRKVDLRVFKPFGYTPIIYVHLELRTKLDVKAERVFLIGMAEGQLCYQVYYNAKQSIVHARDVTFIEEQDETLFVNDSQMERDRLLDFRKQFMSTIGSKVQRTKN